METKQRESDRDRTINAASPLTARETWVWYAHCVCRFSSTSLLFSPADVAIGLIARYVSRTKSSRLNKSPEKKWRAKAGWHNEMRKSVTYRSYVTMMIVILSVA